MWVSAMRIYNGNNPCAEPWTKGEGEAALTRFYYDALQRKCLAFNYFGTKGNQNNFLTRESCETSCPVWINPCAIGQPTLTSDQHPFRCHQGAPCSSGYYCHIGFDESTTACCPSQGDPCSLIVKEGRGTQSIQRWFYNQKTRQCQPFTYKALPNPCTAPPRNPGEGPFHATRWAFDGSTRKCVPFEYRGLRGNANNFLTREDCERRCPGSDPCSQPLDRGVGSAGLQRWYWNPQAKSCMAFRFTILTLLMNMGALHR
ncbi:Kunitz/Bovine pancreatic trypsin inhibitor domain protein [Ancylostoma ceylanicum]|uniref:Kunitz/Bovine pancreatic trypsin inhibitor domain protein n=1 Tax=Ancylostoma ceylanicum TaxID=53326 RepID=A0A0D6LIF4_9BILA|nr:Kunitz/Bovine pancreatic trypsin inhibitor domain protein [Ancylostoma ceylanicum]